MTKARLTIELIPQTSFFFNLRTLLKKKEWDIVKKTIYKKAKYKCEICGGIGKKHPVECHEIWDYNTNIQTLKRLIALCPPCHMVKHFGLHQMLGKEKMLIKRLMTLNNWTNEQAYAHVNEAFSIWQDRNNVKWELDTSLLQNILQQKD